MSTKSYWQRFERQRISRRRVLAAGGVGAAGLAIAAACGGGDGGGDNGPDATAVPTGTNGGPKYGGRYVYHIEGDWGTIDPLTSVGFAPGIFPRIYSALLDRSRIQSDVFYFDLAEELEQPDAETYLFKLRQGVKIAPNTLGIEERDMDAADVKSWFDRIDGDERAVLSPFAKQNLESVTVTDPQTVTLMTNKPYAYTLFRIGAPLGSTIPPREFFEQGLDIEAQGVGAGPFGTIKAGSFSESGGIVAQRNPNYYRTADNGDQLPYLDEIEAVRISDRQPRRVSFLDGQIDSYTAEDRAEVDGLLDDVSDALVTETANNTYIAFNMHPEKAPWNDEKIRKAAGHALNRQEFVDLIVGPEGGRPNGLVHWPLGDFALSPEELEELQPYDPARSRELIKEATGEDSIDIKVMYPVSDIQFHDKHLPIFLSQMAEAGFNIEEDVRDFGNWLVNYQNLEYDASLSLNQVYETAEIPLDWHSVNGPQGDRNFGTGIGGLYPEIEAAIADTKTKTDPDEHIAAVLETQRMIYEKGPSFLPIMSWTAFTLYHSYVKNVPTGLGATGLYLWNEAYIDKGE